MRTSKIILSIGIVTTLLFITPFAKANSDSTKIYFQQAFKEVKNMLEEKQPMSFEKAVFVTENAYLENKFSYQDFQQIIDANLIFIRALTEANNKEASKDFRTLIDFSKPNFDINTLNYTEKEKKEMYRKTLANWAIFTYMTDTTYYFGTPHLPFSYQIKDPFGMNDWKNSQVSNLLTSEEQKGNCFALVSLFKILSDRLNSEAYICTAPQHIYIQHQDDKGDFYNVELATGTHPGDGSLQTLTYTFYEGIVSGISLRRLKQEKQTIALCLVNLGKSYEHKFKTRNDDFILQCAELALKYDSLSLNAMLLKEQVLEERIIKYATEKKITDISKLKLDKGIAVTYKKLETQIIKLYELGYHQMPLYMQEMILAGLQRKGDEKIIVQDRTPNPFPSLKNVAPEDKRYSTLSGGLFEEVHEKKQFEQYGRFTIDTDKKKITKMESESNFKFLIDPVVFAWSVDPMTAATPGWSPYAAFNNNPILNIDADGNFSISNHYKFTRTAVKQLGYGDVVADLVAHYSSVFADHPAKWITYQQGQYYKTGIDYSKTASSQNTASPEYSAWHAMRADNEKITDAAALERGLSFGWSKILEAGEQAKKIGGVDKLQKNSAGIQALGQGIHALQDAIAHKGTDMEGHDLMNDMYPSSSDITKATQAAFNAVLVTEVLSGNYSNVKEGMTIDLTGTNTKQYNQITSAFENIAKKVSFTGKPKEEKK